MENSGLQDVTMDHGTTLLAFEQQPREGAKAYGAFLVYPGLKPAEWAGAPREQRFSRLGMPPSATPWQTTLFVGIHWVRESVRQRAPKSIKKMRSDRDSSLQNPRPRWCHGGN